MNKKLNNFMILLGIVVVLLYGVFTARKKEQRYEMITLCKQCAEHILKDAKASDPEQGQYKAELEIVDRWNTPLKSDLKVAEFSNSVKVYSAGRDQKFNTKDDISCVLTDQHIRKGLEAGSQSIGKGLAKGVIKGVAEAGKEGIQGAKAAAKKAKNNIMSKFKKQEDK